MHKAPNQRHAEVRVPQFNQNRSETNTLLAQLPKLPERKPFSLSASSLKEPVVVCVGCGGRTDGDDSFQQSVNGCRKCIEIYAKIDAAIIESAERRKRQQLEKFFAEVQR